MAKAKNPADYIHPLHINGLSGRMIRIQPPKKHSREILFIYGHHASLERYFGVAEYLNGLGGITVPDLPGFGGMDSFYKIGEKPTLDNMADYLAAFIKLRYKKRRFIISGYSLALMIITRMLQKYPEITKKVDMVVSIAGFTHKSDFEFSRKRILIYKAGTWLFSHRLPALFFRYVILQSVFIRYAYRHMHNAKQKFIGKTGAELEKTIAMEVQLWQRNDVRTYMYSARTMLSLDLTNHHIDLPVYHAGVENDHYFDNVRVEEHMRQIFSDFIEDKIKTPTHAPSVIATAKDAELFIPKTFIKLMKKPN